MFNLGIIQSFKNLIIYYFLYLKTYPNWSFFFELWMVILMMGLIMACRWYIILVQRSVKINGTQLTWSSDFMKIRYLNEQGVTAVAQMKLDHWQTVYRGMIDDDYLDELTLEREISGIASVISIESILKTLSAEESGKNMKTVCEISSTLKRMIYIIIAENEDNEIIGFCIFGYRWAVSSDTRNFNDYDYQIHELYVPEMYRHKGVGSKLIRFAFKEAIKLGQEKVLVRTHAENKNAIYFYKKMGGNIIGESEIELGSKSYPQVVIGFQLEYFLATPSR